MEKLDLFNSEKVVTSTFKFDEHENEPVKIKDDSIAEYFEAIANKRKIYIGDK